MTEDAAWEAYLAARKAALAELAEAYVAALREAEHD